MPATTDTLAHNLFTVPDTHPEGSRDQVSGWGDIKLFPGPEVSHADAYQLIATLSHPQPYLLGMGLWVSFASVSSRLRS